MIYNDQIVLIVDDDRTGLRLLEKVLQRSFRTVSATSGQEALQIIKRQEISVLVTDQRMPGMSGTDLVREVRSSNRHIVCMLLTAHNDPTTVIEAVTRSGAVRVIPKPWEPDRITQAVKEAIDMRERLLDNARSINRLKQATASLDKIVKNQG